MATPAEPAPIESKESIEGIESGTVIEAKTAFYGGPGPSEALDTLDLSDEEVES
jgi:hypothetical protein